MDSVVAHAELRGNADAEIGNAALMAGGIGIAAVDGLGNHLNRLLEAGAQALLRFSPGDRRTQCGDAEAEIRRDLFQEPLLRLRPGAGSFTIRGEHGHASFSVAKRKSDGRSESVPESMFAPGSHVGIVENLVRNLHFP